MKPQSASDTVTRPRPPRAEGFFGLHFDFHAQETDKGIGRRVTAAMVDGIIRTVRPDWVQIDNKGHRGLSSYPTRVGHPAPGIVRDPLRIWRDATARHGVPLYAHHSGIWDTEAIRRHPGWAVRDAQGRRDEHNTSVFGPYAERLLIPQLLELIEDYGLDGVWIDGDCWAHRPDWCRHALRAWRATGSAAPVPRAASDPGWNRYLDFCREGFRRYLRAVCDAVHARAPRFQFASNWAFSSFMPEPVSAGVDFLSGDFSALRSSVTARYEARCLMGQGKPWDLMAWGFGSRHGDPLNLHAAKSPVQLMQEAAVVLALGGGFQIYFSQKRDASVARRDLRVAAEVARFCRARQAACHRAESVPQVALVNSTAHNYAVPNQFQSHGRQTHAIRGILNALLDERLAVDVLHDAQVAERAERFPILVVPETERFAPRLRRCLIRYARQGGTLLLVGIPPGETFRAQLGQRWLNPRGSGQRYVSHGKYFAATNGVQRDFRLPAGVRRWGRFWKEHDTRGEHGPAGCVRRLGQGRIAWLACPLGERFLHGSDAAARRILGEFVRELFPQPMVTVEGAGSVEVTLMRKDRSLCVNLVNMDGPHRDANVFTFDELRPTGRLIVRMRCGRRPRRVRLEPSGRTPAWRWRDGVAVVRVPPVAVHTVIVADAGPVTPAAERHTSGRTAD